MRTPEVQPIKQMVRRFKSRFLYPLVAGAGTVLLVACGLNAPTDPSKSKPCPESALQQGTNLETAIRLLDLELNTDNDDNFRDFLRELPCQPNLKGYFQFNNPQEPVYKGQKVTPLNPLIDATHFAMSLTGSLPDNAIEQNQKDISFAMLAQNDKTFKENINLRLDENNHITAKDPHAFEKRDQENLYLSDEEIEKESQRLIAGLSRLLRRPTSKSDYVVYRPATRGGTLVYIRGLYNNLYTLYASASDGGDVQIIISDANSILARQLG